MEVLSIYDMYPSFGIFLESRGYWGSQGAGVLAIATDIGKWLVALRSGGVGYEPHTWSTIGGKIDDEEMSPDQAARREFFEETEYNGPLTLHPAYVYVSPEKDKLRKPKFSYHNFIGEIVKGDWEPQINWETDRFVWVGYEGLMELSPKHFGFTALLKHSGDVIRHLSKRYNA